MVSCLPPPPPASTCCLAMVSHSSVRRNEEPQRCGLEGHERWCRRAKAFPVDEWRDGRMHIYEGIGSSDSLAASATHATALSALLLCCVAGNWRWSSLCWTGETAAGRSWLVLVCDQLTSIERTNDRFRRIVINLKRHCGHDERKLTVDRP